MKRTVITLSIIFALLPITAHAEALPMQEGGQRLTRYTPTKPIEAPVIAEATPAAEIPVPAPEPAPAAPTVPTGTTYTGCGDNWYANYIYMHESGCNTWNPNQSSGACGLGQAWPCSKLTAVCPNMDYDCENAWFNDYAARMGGWEAAYNYWVSHGNW